MDIENTKFNELETYVINQIKADTLKENHTRKELAKILRRLSPGLVKQSPYACRSMCKKRMCQHIEFAILLHENNRKRFKEIRR